MHHTYCEYLVCVENNAYHLLCGDTPPLIVSSVYTRHVKPDSLNKQEPARLVLPFKLFSPAYFDTLVISRGTL